MQSIGESDMIYFCQSEVINLFSDAIVERWFSFSNEVVLLRDICPTRSDKVKEVTFWLVYERTKQISACLDSFIFYRTWFANSFFSKSKQKLIKMKLNHNSFVFQIIRFLQAISIIVLLSPFKQLLSISEKKSYWSKALFHSSSKVFLLLILLSFISMLAN